MPQKQTKEATQKQATPMLTDKAQRTRPLPVWLGPVLIAVIVALFWLPQLLNNAAAEVNGESISKAQLDQRVAFERLWGEWSGEPVATSGAEAALFRSQVLDQMIQNRMVMQEARKAGVSASAKDVADAVAGFQAQLGMTDAQMMQDMQRAGLNRATLEAIMREDVLIDRFVSTVVVTGLTEEEQSASVRNWYNDTLAKAKIEKHVESGGVKVGQPAPDFVLNDLNGKPVRLSDYKGRPVFVNFFATWCDPCRQEMPDIEAAWQAYKERGLVVLAVNLTSQDDAGDVAAFVKDLGLTFPVVLDESGSVTSLYRVVPIPTSFFIDKNGVVVKAEVRVLSRQAMDQRIAALLQ